MILNSLFTGEIGIHFPLHVLNRYSLPELITLAERSRNILGQHGFTQVWTNDNLEYRSVLASFSGIGGPAAAKTGNSDYGTVLSQSYRSCRGVCDHVGVNQRPRDLSRSRTGVEIYSDPSR